MAKERSDKPGKGAQPRQAAAEGADGEDTNAAKRPKTKEKQPSTAFDLWLQRELQDMFSGVSREPIPDELLRLIDEGKPKPK